MDRNLAEQHIEEAKNAIKCSRPTCRELRDNEVRLRLHALANDLGDFPRALALPDEVGHRSLTTLREKLVKIGAKVVSHGRYIRFRPATPERGGWEMIGKLKATPVAVAALALIATGAAADQVWVTNMKSANVTVIDAGSNKAIATIPAGKVFSPDGKRAYVVRRAVDEVAVLDTAARKMVRSEYVGDPYAVCLIRKV